MSHCHCENCTSDPLPTYRREFLSVCEARLVLSWSLAKRREYLQKLSPERAEPLKAEMKRQHAGRSTASGTDSCPTESSASPMTGKQGSLL